MAYDPKLIYKKLAELLGGTRGSAAESRGEYMDVPGVGSIRVGAYERQIPKSAGGWAEEWDPMEIWTRAAKGTEINRQPRYGEGEIPDWVRNAGGLFSAAAASGKADPEDLQGLARHWLLGEGVNPFYKEAHEAMPAWVKAYLEGIMGGYKSGAPVSGTGLENPRGPHPSPN